MTFRQVIIFNPKVDYSPIRHHWSIFNRTSVEIRNKETFERCYRLQCGSNTQSRKRWMKSFILCFQQGTREHKDNYGSTISMWGGGGGGGGERTVSVMHCVVNRWNPRVTWVRALPITAGLLFNMSSVSPFGRSDLYFRPHQPSNCPKLWGHHKSAGRIFILKLTT